MNGRIQHCANCDGREMRIEYENDKWPYGRANIICEECNNIVIKGIET